MVSIVESSTCNPGLFKGVSSRLVLALALPSQPCVRSGVPQGPSLLEWCGPAAPALGAEEVAGPGGPPGNPTPYPPLLQRGTERVIESTSLASLVIITIGPLPKKEKCALTLPLQHAE